MDRVATIADHAAVARIERAAGARFREIGMPQIADDDPISEGDFTDLLARDGAWIWEVDGSPVGYLLLEALDDAAHVEQLSVDPASGRRGIGTALLEVAVRWAGERELPALTLTTFRDVPWNAPFYARRGFRILTPDDYGPQLAERVRSESAHGLDRWPRVSMRRARG